MGAMDISWAAVQSDGLDSCRGCTGEEAGGGAREEAGGGAREEAGVGEGVGVRQGVKLEVET